MSLIVLLKKCFIYSFLLLFLSLSLICCSRDDDSEKEVELDDLKVRIEWSTGGNFEFLYHNGREIGGVLHKKFDVLGKSGLVEIIAICKDVEGQIVETKSESYNVALGNQYEISVSCKYVTAYENQWSSIILESPQANGDFLFEIEEREFVEIEILGLE